MRWLTLALLLAIGAAEPMAAAELLPAARPSIDPEPAMAQPSTSNERLEPVEVEEIIAGLLAARHPATGLAPSHLGHPGYESVAFTYDKAVDALVLEAAGRHNEAKQILDYFARQLRAPSDAVCGLADSNGVYGVLKCYREGDGPPVLGFVNALDVSSIRHRGKARLEFSTTPGPMAFVIAALLAVDTDAYRAEAVTLGETLLRMQRPDGGVVDGDRSPARVHTEPHMDAVAVFTMLAGVTGDARWQRAADRAFDWFTRHVYHRDEATIDQGVWETGPNPHFATDVYSWTLAGPAGDRLPLAETSRLTETMLRRCLARVAVPLSDGTTRTLTLVDFTDATDAQAVALRGGVRPMGSTEWTGGVVLALQKQAARAWQAGDSSAARRDKALAEALLNQARRAFYAVPSLAAGRVSFYATGQGVDVGPFGTDPWNRMHGWHTPFFHAVDADGLTLARGGSLIGAWIVLPWRGLNPFVLRDGYRAAYDQIPHEPADRGRAEAFLDEAAEGHVYAESVPSEVPGAMCELLEPEWYNQRMWQALVWADQAKTEGRGARAAAGYGEAIAWARRTIDHPIWRALAERDNTLKDGEVGGLVWYPWGATYEANDHRLHTAILRYPLLNEVAAAMWVAAIASYELGLPEQTTHWMGELVESLPLHQVAAVVKDPTTGRPELISGYSNALVSWEDNPGHIARDAAMQPIYRQVLQALGRPSARPSAIRLPDRNP
jgi:hypothetical protein